MMELRLAASCSALASVLCLAQPVLAEIEKNAVGSITATIGDTPYAGETLAVPSEGTSTAEYRVVGPVTSISIQAHDPRADSIMRNVLSLDVSLMGSGASATLMGGASVSWWPDGMSKPFYLSEGSGAEPEVALDAFSLADGAGSIEGRFSARLCRQDSFFAEPDANDCLVIKGTFKTALRKAD